MESLSRTEAEAGLLRAYTSAGGSLLAVHACFVWRTQRADHADPVDVLLSISSHAFLRGRLKSAQHVLRSMRAMGSQAVPLIFASTIIRDRTVCRSLSWALHGPARTLSHTLTSDLGLTSFLPCPHLVCSPESSLNGCGMLVQPRRIAHFRKEGMPCFKRDGHLVVTPQSFLCFVGDHWPHAQVLPLASIYLRAVWTVGNEIAAFSLSCFVGLALVLRSIETVGVWPEKPP